MLFSSYSLAYKLLTNFGCFLTDNIKIEKSYILKGYTCCFDTYMQCTLFKSGWINLLLQIVLIFMVKTLEIFLFGFFHLDLFLFLIMSWGTVWWEQVLLEVWVKCWSYKCSWAHMGVRNLTPPLQQEQCALLTSESSLQPPSSFLKHSV